MSSLAEITAAPWEREIAGRAWRFSPLTLGDWAVLERRVLESRPDPLALAKSHLEGLNRDAQRELLDAALVAATRSRRVTLAELLEFAESTEGLTLSIWLSLRREHPELTEAEAGALLDRWTADEMAELERSLDALRGAPAEPPKKLTAPVETASELDWRRVFGRLARRYRWPPREIARLTLAQAIALLQPDAPASRVQRLPLAAGLKLAARVEAERRARAEQALEGL